MTKKADSLVDLAEKDISHATDNIGTHPNHAAFSVQQAAEKLIKAVLEQENITYPSTSHQLDDLVGRVPPTNPFKGDLIPLTRLTSAATKYRYPTARGGVPDDPPMSEIVEDLKSVTLLLPEIRDWLREER
jgi:HEPN domain-containing protein